MFIKIDENKKILEATTDEREGYIEYEGEIDIDKFMFASYIDERIVYDEQAYNEFLNMQNEHMNNEKEITELEKWLTEYNKVCSEHACCTRLGIECKHNIIDWDDMAIINIRRLNELKIGGK